MNLISATFQKLQAEGRKAFIPFISAGDPNLDVTRQLIVGLSQAGATFIEVGFPFSDPIADGPVIQASYTRALDGGLSLDALFAMLEGLKSVPGLAPRIGMVSYSIVYKQGLEAFVQRCVKANLSGLILPDVPVEEAEDIAPILKAAGIALILLVTPTSSPERITRIVSICEGFVYCVSLVGITGTRSELPPTVVDYLSRLRAATTLPLCLGFGISRPDQVGFVRNHVDGVIVGSALVKLMADIHPANPQPGIEHVLSTAGKLAQATNSAG